MEMRSCPICHKSFAPAAAKHIYCSNKCRDLAHKRRRRLDRQLSGRCPQCGREHDHPFGQHKPRISYCSACAAYFRDRYRKKRAEETKSPS